MTDIKKIVYHRWLDAERDCRYWQTMANLNDKIDGRFNLAIGLLSSGAAINAVLSAVIDLGLPNIAKISITGGLALLSAAFSFYTRHNAYGKKASRFAMLHGMLLQQLSAWKRVRDQVMVGGMPSADLMLELTTRSEAMLAFEAGHTQDDKVALECEEAARRLAKQYEESFQRISQQRGVNRNVTEVESKA